MIDEFIPSARNVLEQQENNRVEADRACRKARLRPMRRMKTIKSLRVIAAGHAFVQDPAPRPRRTHHRGANT